MSELRMFLKIAGAYSAEQSGIRGVKMPFDPNIFMNYTAKIKKMHLIEKNYQHVKSLYY